MTKEKTDKLADIIKHGELKYITYSEYLKLVGDKAESHVKSHCEYGGELYCFRFDKELVPYTEVQYLLHLYHVQKLSSFVLTIHDAIKAAKLRMDYRNIKKIKTV